MFLFSVKLSKIQEENDEETYDVVMAPEDLLEEQELATLSPKQVKIETNKAYNEAEKFISSIEHENEKLTESTEEKLQKMEEALNNSELNKEGNTIQLSAKEENKKKKTTPSNSEKNTQNQGVASGGNRNTTISYQLVNRTDLDLPNPVYTCYGSGKVVINIEVDHLGRVKKTTYNRAVSTTSNQCLIDAALEYASQAQFTSDASRAKQLGTITFNFPGQQ